MATTQELNLKINGDTLGAVNSLKALEAELARLQKLAKDPSLTFDQLKTVGSSISKAKSEIASLNSVVGKSTKDFSGWTRVIQDAPFGFIAISNNLTQLIPAAGAAGLAFSGLVAAISFAQVGFQNWVRGGEESKKMSEELAEAIKQIGAAADRASEDMDQFKSSLDFAKEIGDLEIKIANFGKIGGGNIKMLQLEDRLNNQLLDRLAIQKKLLEGASEELTQREVKAAVGSEESKAIAEEQKKVLDQMIEFNFKEADLLGNRERFKLQIELAGLQNQKEIDDKEKAQRDKKLADLKKQLEEEERLHFERLKALRTDFVPTQLGLNTFQITNPSALGSGGKTPLANVPKQIQPHIRVSPILDFDLTDAEKQAIKAIEAMTENLNSALQQGVVDGLSGVAEGIGQAIAGGGISDILKSAADSMGSLLQSLGKMMIETAIKVKIFKEAFTKWIIANPGLAILAGAGLIVAGSLIKASVPKVKPFAEGGLVFGPTMGLVGEGRGTNRSNPEVIAPLDKLKGMLSGVGGGRQVFIPSLKFSYNEFQIAFNRSNKFGGLTS